MKSNCLNYKEQKFDIQGLTRLNEDGCYQKFNSATIQKPGIYHTRNFHDCLCGAPTVLEMTLQHPRIIHRDGHGWTSMGGCNIDADSKMRNAKNFTNTRCINQLNVRPHATTPYMGRGQGNICIETKLLPGEDTSQKRQCNNLAGISIDRFIPQLPCIRDNIQKAKHLIPEDNNSEWVRGGQPSRQNIRDKEYLRKCGFKDTGKFWKK